MANNWTIELGEGASKVTIAANGRFQIGAQKEVEGNLTKAVIWTLSIDGEVLGAMPGTVADGFVTMMDQAGKKGLPIRIRILLDGVAKWDWKPWVGFNGPFITSGSSTDSPGNGQSHWTYHLEAVFRSAEIDDKQQEVFEFTASLSTTKDHDRVIRKVWTVSAKALTETAARSFVIGFKPASDDLQEEIKDDITDLRCMAVWVWEALQQVFCQVSYEGGGRDYVEDTQAGLDVAPILFNKPRTATRIRVRGYVRGFNQLLIVPTKHFSESATLREVTGRPRHRIEIEDDKRGIYRLPFEELWICTEDIDPEPDHEGNHQLIALDASSVPAAGKILT